MNDQIAQGILDKIVGQVFGYKNPFTLEQFRTKFAFDVRLPNKVADSTTGEEAWASSINPTKFITMENAWNMNKDTDGMFPAQQLNSIQDILNAWGRVNLTATDRQLESLNVAKSDAVYNSENIYYSQDVSRSKNILFCDGVMQECEFVAASQRSQSSSFCIRLEDSKESSNSFSVSWSGKVVNSFFIHDCSDIFESMFCSHVNSRKFCIANMQYEEAEYMRLKQIVLQWILTQ